MLLFVVVPMLRFNFPRLLLRFCTLPLALLWPRDCGGTPPYTDVPCCGALVLTVLGVVVAVLAGFGVGPRRKSKSNSAACLKSAKS